MVQAQYCSEWSVLRCSALVRFLCPEIIDYILQWTRSVLHVFSNEAMLSPGLFDHRPGVIRNGKVIWKPKFRPYFHLPQSCMAQDFFKISNPDKYEVERLLSDPGLRFQFNIFFFFFGYLNLHALIEKHTHTHTHKQWNIFKNKQRNKNKKQKQNKTNS